MAGPGRPKTGGRRKGTSNKRTVDGEAYARAIVEDAQVRDRLLAMAQDGTLSPELLKTFLAYAFGKPQEPVIDGDGNARTVTISF